MAQRSIDKLTDDELFADWEVVAKRAYDDAINLHWNRRMYRLLAAVYKANPRLQEAGGHLWTWMRDNYVAGAAMAVRRELDKDGSVANLRNMLHEMIQRPSVLRRRRYLEHWNPTDEWQLALANRGFDSFGVVKPSANPEEDHIDPAGVAADLEQLDVQTDTVRAYIEQTIAHRQRSTPASVSFAQFNETIAAIEKALKKYYALVTQTSVAQLEPVPQYNTTEVFTFPWLAPGTTLDLEQ
jgi:hypothetical protein